MKTKYFTIGLLASATLMVTSCNDGDFLTESPKTIYTTDNAYNTVDQIKANVTNLYVHIRYWYQNDYFMKGLGSDILDSPYFRSTGNGYSNFSKYSASSNETNKIYEALFQLANYANQTLEGYNTPGLAWDEAEKKEVYGQIMFFRGYAYLSLGELFGGVPLVDRVYKDVKLDFTRSSREETYNFAIKDLEAAVDNLPEYPSEAGRIAKGAAYHFLAEAYVARATIKGNDKTDLDKAISYADQAIALHPLMTKRFGTRATPGEGTTKNGVPAYYADGNVFFDLFQEGNYDYSEGNTEAIWTLQNDYAVYHQYGGNNYVNSPREMSAVLRDVTWSAAHKEKDNADIAVGPWAGNIDTEEYPGGNVSAYVGGRGVGSMAPTSYVITDIWNGDEGDLRNAPCNIRRTFKCMDTKSKWYGKEVPLDELDFTSQKITEYWPLWTKQTPIDDWGYDDLADGGNRSNMYCDQYALRSSETYLLAAEAYLREGNKDKAAEYINKVRGRSEAADVAPANVTIQYILDERARELYGEERRWCTLLRMNDGTNNDGIKSINAHAMYIVDQPFWRGYFTTKHDPVSKWTLFPIPQTIIDTNTGAKIEQNPGW